jgi:hypothetical protein
VIVTNGPGSKWEAEPDAPRPIKASAAAAEWWAKALEAGIDPACRWDVIVFVMKQPNDGAFFEIGYWTKRQYVQAVMYGVEVDCE